MDDYLVVFVTAPSQRVGRDLARGLVDRRLAACVSIIPSITSVYAWEGEVCVDEEVLLVIKTTRVALDGLTSSVRDLHPYDVPEIIAVPVTAGFPEYLEWVGESVGP